MSGSTQRICSNGKNQTRSVRAYDDILLFDLPFPRQLTRGMSYFSLMWNVQKSGESLNSLACILLVCWLNLPHMELSKSLPRASYPGLLPNSLSPTKCPRADENGRDAPHSSVPGFVLRAFLRREGKQEKTLALADLVIFKHQES